METKAGRVTSFHVLSSSLLVLSFDDVQEKMKGLVKWTTEIRYVVQSNNTVLITYTLFKDPAAIDISQEVEISQH
jgi:hypothetical protein